MEGIEDAVAYFNHSYVGLAYTAHLSICGVRRNDVTGSMTAPHRVAHYALHRDKSTADDKVRTTAWSRRYDWYMCRVFDRAKIDWQRGLQEEKPNIYGFENVVPSEVHDAPLPSVRSSHQSLNTSKSVQYFPIR